MPGQLPSPTGTCSLAWRLLQVAPRALLPTLPDDQGVSKLPRQCPPFLTPPLLTHTSQPLPVLRRGFMYPRCSSHLPSSSSLALPVAEPLPFHCLPPALRHSLPNHSGMVLAQKKPKCRQLPRSKRAILDCSELRNPNSGAFGLRNITFGSRRREPWGNTGARGWRLPGTRLGRGSSAVGCEHEGARPALPRRSSRLYLTCLLPFPPPRAPPSSPQHISRFYTDFP